LIFRKALLVQRSVWALRALPGHWGAGAKYAFPAGGEGALPSMSLVDIGLGYLQLGQPATTLSGSEAQRVKLAKELGRRARDHTLYLLDDPTTGLHLADTARLENLLQRLIDGSNSVLVVEHDLKRVKTADWIIDLGPEGTAAYGQLIAQGTPEQVAQESGSHTGLNLNDILWGEL
jgi:excinuclease ABC subunit A